FGYLLVLMAIAFVRELFGFGTLFGMEILGAWWTKWSIMVMAPSAFFLLAILIWIINNRFYKVRV
ncbi:MAG: Rnf-Nqr domain containing protein, partial [Candidatus Cloacimonadaceae bacterium]|nr:Rnf-Nqr domain containing protein [Candidatus Cloacimonadaceae bacterium]